VSVRGLTETRKLLRTVVFLFLADSYGFQYLNEIRKRISTFTVNGRLQNSIHLWTQLYCNRCRMQTCIYCAPGKSFQ